MTRWDAINKPSPPKNTDNEIQVSNFLKHNLDQSTERNKRFMNSKSCWGFFDSIAISISETFRKTGTATVISYWSDTFGVYSQHDTMPSILCWLQTLPVLSSISDRIDWLQINWNLIMFLIRLRSATRVHKWWSGVFHVSRQFKLHL